MLVLCKSNTHFLCRVHLYWILSLTFLEICLLWHSAKKTPTTSGFVKMGKHNKNKQKESPPYLTPLYIVYTIHFFRNFKRKGQLWISTSSVPWEKVLFSIYVVVLACFGMSVKYMLLFVLNTENFILLHTNVSFCQLEKPFVGKKITIYVFSYFFFCFCLLLLLFTPFINCG